VENKMQSAFSIFAENDYARYPFLKGAAKYLKIPDLRVGDLTNPELEEVLKRAEERLEEAILHTCVSRRLEKAENEVASYPIAIILAIATKSGFIQKRYALAEAKRTFEDLKGESQERILAFARNFGWELSVNDDAEIPYEFKLRFSDYLKNTSHLREKKWRLVNRLLSRGNVFLTRSETARLLSEEVRKHIEKRLETKELPTFPPQILEIAEKIKRLPMEKAGKAEREDFPQTIVPAAFPPCINALYQATSSGHHLSHIGRFTLTSFLVNVGMPSETVMALFRNFSDYSERVTRYQVEHIAGGRGSRTHYTPPSCDTLQTHGVCANPDETCRRIRHPLAYYRRKLKRSRIDQKTARGT
jgi:DNA primase large subunit